MLFRRNRWLIWPLAVFVWGAFALTMAYQSYRDGQCSTPADTFALHVRMALTDWFGWGALMPLALLATRRAGFFARPWPRACGAMLLIAVAMVFAQLGIHVLVDLGLETVEGHDFSAARHFAELLGPWLWLNLLLAFGLVAAAHGFEAYRRMVERGLRTTQLEASLAQARLQALTLQLQPHFLFNALNAISALMHRDVDAADRMVARLSEMLRLSLDTAGDQEVTLRRELELLQPYLEIEQIRFGDRLALKMEIEPDALDAHVPCLLLQPLIENAIRHGVGARPAGGRVEVSARRRNGQLELNVADNGPGLVASANGVKRGIGLSNTQARLAQLYGADHRFELSEAAGGGFEVGVCVPFRSAA